MSQCPWCRVTGAHLSPCPHDSPSAQLVWEEGRRKASLGMANPNADDEVFTLGYTIGETQYTGELAVRAHTLF